MHTVSVKGESSSTLEGNALTQHPRVRVLIIKQFRYHSFLFRIVCTSTLACYVYTYTVP